MMIPHVVSNAKKVMAVAENKKPCDGGTGLRVRNKKRHGMLPQRMTERGGCGDVCAEKRCTDKACDDDVMCCEPGAIRNAGGQH